MDLSRQIKELRQRNGLSQEALAERIKKKHDLITYTEIVAFVDGKSINREELAREKKYRWRSTLLKIVGAAAAGLILAILSNLIAHTFFI